MIDAGTGRITLGEFEIEPRLKKEAFLLSAKGKNATPGPPLGNEWSSYTLQQTIGENYFSVVLRFKGSKLFIVEIMKTSPKEVGSSWETWSEGRETQRKHDHDRLLRSILGEPPYKYSWGRVTSDYEPKVGSSAIVINYSS